MDWTMEQINQVIAAGPYRDDWDSLLSHPAPEWFTKAKFGIFIHWGAYSVPAFGSEWYPRNMYLQGSPEFEHHVKTYGPHKDFGYKDFIPLFRAERFDPAAWAELFREAGAQYVVPVAEHHDGFQMYKSDISHWNAAEMGPKRDVLGELSRELAKQGLTLGASSHRAEHWFFLGHGKEFDSDVKEPLQRGDLYWPAMPEGGIDDLFSQPEPDREYLEDWLLRTCELIDSYRPKLLYFDWWIQHRAFKPYLKKLAAYYYNRAEEWGEQVLINYKHDAFLFGTAVVDVERGQFSETKSYPWQTDTAVALNSWCYTEGNCYKQASDILCDLMDIVSKNGNLLLNIGPRADGTIPQEDASILREIGDWLRTNGEAVYGARPWKKFGEGPTQVADGQFSDSVKKEFTPADIRYTVNGDALYAAVLKGDPLGEYHFTLLSELGEDSQFRGLIRSVEVLGSGGSCTWTRDRAALHVRTDAPQGNSPIVFKILMG